MGGWPAALVGMVGMVSSNCRTEGVCESRTRDPREEMDRVLRFPGLIIAAWCGRSPRHTRYKVGTVRTEGVAYLQGGPGRERAFGWFGGWCEGGGSKMVQTRTRSAQHRGRAERLRGQKAWGERRHAGTATGRDMRWARRRSSGHCCAGWTLEMIAHGRPRASLQPSCWTAWLGCAPANGTRALAAHR